MIVIDRKEFMINSENLLEAANAVEVFYDEARDRINARDIHYIKKDSYLLELDDYLKDIIGRLHMMEGVISDAEKKFPKL